MSTLTKRELEISERWHATMERQKRLITQPVADFTGQARALAAQRQALRLPRKRFPLLRGVLTDLGVAVGDALQTAWFRALPYLRHALAVVLAWPLCALAWGFAWGIALDRPIPVAPPVLLPPAPRALSWQAQRALCERCVSKADQAMADLERFETRTLVTCAGLMAGLAVITLTVGV